MRFEPLLKEDCVGEYQVFVYTLEKAITQAMVERLSGLGTLQVFHDFPKPYFRLQSNHMLLKGVIQTPRLDVTFYDAALEEKSKLENILAQIP
ncbi:MAG TPA: hypothetical protein P5560_09930 [Thermotogota bacterium]|nr:hypothetical protein [Thermotogota bacterium]HRW93253.1 hypothetical protein [Thermotogota bacterium]